MYKYTVYIERNVYIDSLDIFVGIPFFISIVFSAFSSIFTDFLVKKHNYLSCKCLYLPVTFCSIFSIQ